MRARNSRGADPASRVVAWVVSSALLLVSLDGSVVGVAIPAIAHTFRVRPVDLSIGITSYLLAQTLLLPSAGWLVRRFGARRMFVIALAGFTIGSILCGASRTLAEFVAARMLQGGAASVVIPIARIVLLKSTRKENLIEAIAVTFVPLMVGPTLGPPLGGLVTQYLSWPWIFFLNVPIGVVSTLLVVRLLPPLPAEATQPFDGLGFALLATACGGVVLGSNQLSVDDSSWLVWGAVLAGGIGCAALVIRHLGRTAHPILSLRAMSLQSFSATSLTGGVLVRLPVRALGFILPLLLEAALGFSATRCGLLLLAMSGAFLLLTPVAARMLRRHGFRRVLVGSTALVLFTLVACGTLCGVMSYAGFFVLLAISGMAQAPMFASLNALAFADVPAEEVSHATVLWNLAVQLTGALAVSAAAFLMSLAPHLLQERAGRISIRDCQAAILVMALLGGLSLLSFLRLPRDSGATVSGHREVSC